MNTQTSSKTSRSSVLFLTVLFGCLMLFGCGSEKDDSEEMIQTGADFLAALAGTNFETGWEGRNTGYIGGGVNWADEFNARTDEESFPDWAVNEYDLCIYWERELTYDAVNRDRQPGEPSMHTLEGKAWGWVLMKEADMHVLELGIEFDEQRHLFIDQWESQPG